MTHDTDTITIATMLTSSFVRYFDLEGSDDRVVESAWTVATEVRDAFIGADDPACIAFRADRHGNTDLMAHLSKTYTTGKGTHLNVVAKDLATEIERYLQKRYRTAAAGTSEASAPILRKALPAGFIPVGERLPEDGALVLGLRESGYQGSDFEVVTVKHHATR